MSFLLNELKKNKKEGIAKILKAYRPDLDNFQEILFCCFFNDILFLDFNYVDNKINWNINNISSDSTFYEYINKYSGSGDFSSEIMIVYLFFIGLLLTFVHIIILFIIYIIKEKKKREN